MGLLYSVLLRNLALRRRLTMTAVAYALVSWVTYQYGIMPWLAPVMHRHSSAKGRAVAHAVFGLALGSYHAWRAHAAPRSE